MGGGLSSGEPHGQSHVGHDVPVGDAALIETQVCGAATSPRHLDHYRVFHWQPQANSMVGTLSQIRCTETAGQ